MLDATQVVELTKQLKKITITFEKQVNAQSLGNLQGKLLFKIPEIAADIARITEEIALLSQDLRQDELAQLAEANTYLAIANAFLVNVKSVFAQVPALQNNLKEAYTANDLDRMLFYQRELHILRNKKVQNVVNKFIDSNIVKSVLEENAVFIKEQLLPLATVPANYFAIPESAAELKESLTVIEQQINDSTLDPRSFDHLIANSTRLLSEEPILAKQVTQLITKLNNSIAADLWQRDCELFAKLDVKELAHTDNYSSEIICPNVVAITKSVQNLSSLILAELLNNNGNTSQFCLTLGRWIEIAYKLYNCQEYQARDYSAVQAILGAIRATGVYRLIYLKNNTGPSTLLQSLPKHLLQQLEVLNAIPTTDMERYANHMEQHAGNTIPFIGVYQTYSTFAGDGLESAGKTDQTLINMQDKLPVNLAFATNAYLTSALNKIELIGWDLLEKELDPISFTYLPRGEVLAEQDDSWNILYAGSIKLHSLLDQLTGNKQIIVENDELKLIDKKKSFFGNASTNKSTKQAFEHYLNYIEQSFEQGQPALKLFDKLITSAWGQAVIENNRKEFIKRIQGINHQYLNFVVTSINLKSAELIRNITDNEIIDPKNYTNAKKSPNIVNLLKLSKNISNFFIKEILQETTGEIAVINIERAIRSAYQFYLAKNYVAMYAVIFALNNNAINRLLMNNSNDPDQNKLYSALSNEAKEYFATLRVYATPKGFETLAIALMEQAEGYTLPAMHKIISDMNRLKEVNGNYQKVFGMFKNAQASLQNLANEEMSIDWLQTTVDEQQAEDCSKEILKNFHKVNSVIKASFENGFEEKLAMLNNIALRDTLLYSQNSLIFYSKFTLENIEALNQFYKDTNLLAPSAGKQKFNQLLLTAGITLTKQQFDEVYLEMTRLRINYYWEKILPPLKFEASPDSLGLSNIKHLKQLIANINDAKTIAELVHIRNIEQSKHNNLNELISQIVFTQQEPGFANNLSKYTQAINIYQTEIADLIVDKITLLQQSTSEEVYNDDKRLLAQSAEITSTINNFINFSWRDLFAIDDDCHLEPITEAGVLTWPTIILSRTEIEDKVRKKIAKEEPNYSQVVNNIERIRNEIAWKIIPIFESLDRFIAELRVSLQVQYPAISTKELTGKLTAEFAKYLSESAIEYDALVYLIETMKQFSIIAKDTYYNEFDKTGPVLALLQSVYDFIKPEANNEQTLDNEYVTKLISFIVELKRAKNSEQDLLTLAEHAFAILSPLTVDLQKARELSNKVGMDDLLPKIVKLLVMHGFENDDFAKIDMLYDAAQVLISTADDQQKEHLFCLITFAVAYNSLKPFQEINTYLNETAGFIKQLQVTNYSNLDNVEFLQQAWIKIQQRLAGTFAQLTAAKALQTGLLGSNQQPDFDSIDLYQNINIAINELQQQKLALEQAESDLIAQLNKTQKSSAIAAAEDSQTSKLANITEQLTDQANYYASTINEIVTSLNDSAIWLADESLKAKYDIGSYTLREPATDSTLKKGTNNNIQINDFTQGENVSNDVRTEDFLNRGLLCFRAAAKLLANYNAAANLDELEAQFRAAINSRCVIDYTKIPAERVIDFKLAYEQAIKIYKQLLIDLTEIIDSALNSSSTKTSAITPQQLMKELSSQERLYVAETGRPDIYQLYNFAEQPEIKQIDVQLTCDAERTVPSNVRNIAGPYNYVKEIHAHSNTINDIQVDFIAYRGAEIPFAVTNPVLRIAAGEYSARKMLEAMVMDQIAANKSAGKAITEPLTIAISSMSLLSTWYLDQIRGKTSEIKMLQESVLAWRLLAQQQPLKVCIDKQDITVKLDIIDMNMAVKPILTGIIADAETALNERGFRQFMHHLDQTLTDFSIAANDLLSEHYHMLSAIQQNYRNLRSVYEVAAQNPASALAKANNNLKLLTAKYKEDLTSSDNLQNKYQQLSQYKNSLVNILKLPTEVIDSVSDKKLQKKIQGYQTKYKDLVEHLPITEQQIPTQPEMLQSYIKGYKKTLAQLNKIEAKFDSAYQRINAVEEKIWLQQCAELNNLATDCTKLSAALNRVPVSNSAEKLCLDKAINYCDVLQLSVGFQQLFYERAGRHKLYTKKANWYEAQVHFLIISYLTGRIDKAKCKSVKDRTGRLFELIKAYSVFKQDYGHYPVFGNVKDKELIEKYYLPVIQEKSVSRENTNQNIPGARGKQKTGTLIENAMSKLQKGIYKLVKQKDFTKTNAKPTDQMFKAYNKARSILQWAAENCNQHSLKYFMQAYSNFLQGEKVPVSGISIKFTVEELKQFIELQDKLTTFQRYQATSKNNNTIKQMLGLEINSLELVKNIQPISLRSLFLQAFSQNASFLATDEKIDIDAISAQLPALIDSDETIALADINQVFSAFDLSDELKETLINKLNQLKDLANRLRARPILLEVLLNLSSKKFAEVTTILASFSADELTGSDESILEMLGLNSKQFRQAQQKRLAHQIKVFNDKRPEAAIEILQELIQLTKPLAVAANMREVYDRNISIKNIFLFDKVLTKISDTLDFSYADAFDPDNDLIYTAEEIEQQQQQMIKLKDQLNRAYQEIEREIKSIKKHVNQWPIIQPILDRILNRQQNIPIPNELKEKLSIAIRFIKTQMAAVINMQTDIDELPATANSALTANTAHNALTIQDVNDSQLEQTANSMNLSAPANDYLTKWHNAVENLAGAGDSLIISKNLKLTCNNVEVRQQATDGLYVKPVKATNGFEFDPKHGKINYVVIKDEKADRVNAKEIANILIGMGKTQYRIDINDSFKYQRYAKMADLIIHELNKRNSQLKVPTLTIVLNNIVHTVITNEQLANKNDSSNKDSKFFISAQSPAEPCVDDAGRSAIVNDKHLL